jgi:hypothetical protein
MPCLIAGCSFYGEFTPILDRSAVIILGKDNLPSTVAWVSPCGHTSITDSEHLVYRLVGTEVQTHPNPDMSLLVGECPDCGYHLVISRRLRVSTELTIPGLVRSDCPVCQRIILTVTSESRAVQLISAGAMRVPVVIDLIHDEIDALHTSPDSELYAMITGGGD